MKPIKSKKNKLLFKIKQTVKMKYIYTLKIVQSIRSQKKFLFVSTPEGLEIFEINKNLKLIKLKNFYIKNFNCYEFGRVAECGKFKSIIKGDTFIRNINLADINGDGVEDFILSGNFFPLSWLDGNFEKDILSINNNIKLNIIDKFKTINGIDVKKDKNNNVQYIITASHLDSELILYTYQNNQWLKKKISNTSYWGVNFLNTDNKDKISLVASSFKNGNVTLFEF